MVVTEGEQLFLNFQDHDFQNHFSTHYFDVLNHLTSPQLDNPNTIVGEEGSVSREPPAGRSNGQSETPSSTETAIEKSDRLSKPFSLKWYNDISNNTFFFLSSTQCYNYSCYCCLCEDAVICNSSLWQYWLLSRNGWQIIVSNPNWVSDLCTAVQVRRWRHDTPHQI